MNFLSLVRCPRRLVFGVEEIAAAIEDTGARSVVMDVEPIVACWGSREAALASRVAMMATRLAELSSLQQLVFLTNSARAYLPEETVGKLQVVYVALARKPWKIGSLRGLPTPIIVTGDQVLTDGLLTWRLRTEGAVFCHWSATVAPLWPTLQRWIGMLLIPLLFRPL